MHFNLFKVKLKQNLLKKMVNYYVMVKTATIFILYIASAVYMKVKQQANWTKIIIGTVVLYVIILAVQIVAIYLQMSYQKCSLSWTGIGISWFIGALVAGLFFALIVTTDPSYLPYTTSSIESFTPQASLVGGSSSMVKKPDTAVDSEQSHKPDDKDEFICDLYKNGQLITSTISQ